MARPAWGARGAVLPDDVGDAAQREAPPGTAEQLQRLADLGGLAFPAGPEPASGPPVGPAEPGDPQLARAVAVADHQPTRGARLTEDPLRGARVGSERKHVEAAPSARPVQAGNEAQR